MPKSYKLVVGTSKPEKNQSADTAEAWVLSKPTLRMNPVDGSPYALTQLQPNSTLPLEDVMVKLVGRYAFTKIENQHEGILIVEEIVPTSSAPQATGSPGASMHFMSYVPEDPSRLGLVPVLFDQAEKLAAELEAVRSTLSLITALDERLESDVATATPTEFALSVYASPQPNQNGDELSGSDAPEDKATSAAPEGATADLRQGEDGSAESFSMDAQMGMTLDLTGFVAAEMSLRASANVASGSAINAKSSLFMFDLLQSEPADDADALLKTTSEAPGTPQFADASNLGLFSSNPATDPALDWMLMHSLRNDFI